MNKEAVGPQLACFFGTNYQLMIVFFGRERRILLFIVRTKTVFCAIVNGPPS